MPLNKETKPNQASGQLSLSLSLLRGTEEELCISENVFVYTRFPV